MNTHLLQLSKRIVSAHEKVLPPVDILEQCKQLTKDNSVWTHKVLGRSEQGHPIDMFEFGEGTQHTLWYGFPDPGEALGGTTILALMQELSRPDSPLHTLFPDMTWCFAPVLDFDLQPDEGRSLQHLMSAPGARLVDMCLNDNPRPESLAIIEYADTIKPTFIYSLHDEFHSGEQLPAYAVVYESFPKNLVHALKTIWTHFEYPINTEMVHPTFGEGFLKPDEDEDFYAITTFKRYEAYAQMLIFELSEQPHVSTHDLLTMQLLAGLHVLEALC
mgnify:FL=1